MAVLPLRGVMDKVFFPEQNASGCISGSNPSGFDIMTLNIGVEILPSHAKQQRHADISSYPSSLTALRG